MSSGAATRESALLFVFLGYYPIVKPRFDAIRRRPLRLAAKLLLAIAAVGAEYAFLLFVLRLEAVVTELSSTAPALLWATAALGLALFRILAEEIKPDSGSFKWGLSTSRSYFPADNYTQYDREDRTRLSYATARLKVAQTTLDYNMYPTSGRRRLLELRYIFSHESHEEGTMYADGTEVLQPLKHRITTIWGNGSPWATI